jgi:precorrin-2 dehydrogenase/sirohydrochlorin ferrochelatase
VAAGRILNVLNADAKVTVVSPRAGLNPEVAHRVAQGQVDYVDRKFVPSDLDDVDMVLTAVDDPEASSVIWKLCKERKIAANIADVPPECDFYFGSVHRDGPLQIMVSTNGKGPRLANQIRRSIAAKLPANAGEAITKVGKLRMMLRKIAPDIKEGPKRMAWYVYTHIHVSAPKFMERTRANLGCFFFSFCRMIKVSDAYSLKDLCEMDEEDMHALLRYYEPDKVPRLPCLRAMDNRYDAFDGSFGFCVGF